MKSTGNKVLAGVVGVFLLATCAGYAVGVGYPDTVLFQGPVGYWRLDEALAPPAPQSAVNIGSIGAVGNGRYLFGPESGRYIYGPERGEPGALPGNAATSARFFNPQRDPAYGVSKVEVPYHAAFNPNGPFTVEFWAKPSTLVTDVFCVVASIDSNAEIALEPDLNPRAGWLFYQRGETNSNVNQWQFRMGNRNNYLDEDSIVGGAVTAGEWHHVVGAYDGSTASLYVNGARVASRAINGFEANEARPLRIGTTTFTGTFGAFFGNRGFDGWIQEVAFYGTALSAQTIAAHYGAGRTNGANYATVIRADRPAGYWRLGEPGNPVAENFSRLGAGINGRYVFSADPGQQGPETPQYPGFESPNLACRFDGSNGFVNIPPLNLNTNTVSFTAWILPDGVQAPNAAIVFCNAGTTVAGLKFDINDPNGLSYNWNNNDATFNFKSGLAAPASQWSFVALAVQSDQAVLCLHDGTTFSVVTNFTFHPEQTFDADTLIGRDLVNPARTFNGLIDEVAIFNRTLSVGEIYTQYAAAADNLKPTLFADLPTQVDALFVGDALTLSVDAGGSPPLAYQWRRNGTNIAGAVTAVFSKSSMALSDAGPYEVRIANAYGAVTSLVVNVQVQPPVKPTLGQEPQSRSLYAGGSLDLTVQATGGQLAYQWQKDGRNISGATNANYRVTNVARSDAGNYHVVVSNPSGTTPSAIANVTVIVPTADSYEAVILNDNPESWWRLDDPTSGTLMDAMGRHDGVFKGGVTLGVPGVIQGSTNTAASFDGQGAYAEVPFSRALNTTNFTIECWVKAKPVVSALSAVASFTQPPGRGYLLQKSEDGQWYTLSGNGVQNPMFLMAGSDAIYEKWTHLVATFDGSVFLAYLNGRFDVGIFTAVAPNNFAPLRIGYDQPGEGWDSYWNGEIDEVAYYPEALTADQVAQHYATALYGTNSLPVFVRQLQSATAFAQSNFFFSPLVEGSWPIGYQWSKNGTPIPNETNDTLVLTNLTLSDAGAYLLTASNLVGQTRSTAATLTVIPPPTSAFVTNGLVLHLPFEGNYQDTSGRGNNGQPIGTLQFVPGVVGQSALRYNTEVDASDPENIELIAANYVTLGRAADLQFGSNVNFSVAYWIRFTNTMGDLPFFGNSVNAFTQPGYTIAPSYRLGGWSWSLGTVGTPDYVGIYGPNGSLNDGEWHHVAHTFDRSGSGLTYQDGVLVDSRSIVPIKNLDTGAPTTIGQDPTGTYPEAGEADIDDIGVWRRVLEPLEVNTIYLAGKAGRSFDVFIPGPVSASVTVNRVGREIELSWPSGTLQQADNVSGPWSPVTGASAPSHRITPSAARKFYRIQL